jgi:hypothetical protein
VCDGCQEVAGGGRGSVGYTGIVFVVDRIETRK